MRRWWEVCRSWFDAPASTPGLTDFYTLDLASSASTLTPNESIRTICAFGEWLGQHHSASLTRVESTLLPLVVSSMSPSCPSSPSSPSPALSPSMLAATHSSAPNASSLLSTRSRTKLQLAVLIGTFIGTYTSTSPVLTLLHRMVCLNNLISCTTALFASVLKLGTPLCPLDTSVWFLTPSVSSTPHFASPAPRYVLALTRLRVHLVRSGCPCARLHGPDYHPLLARSVQWLLRSCVPQLH